MRNGYSGHTCRGQSLTSAVDPQLHSRQNVRIAFTGLLIIFIDYVHEDDYTEEMWDELKKKGERRTGQTHKI